MTKLIGSQIQRISWHCALLIALLVPGSALADTWQLQAGAESRDRGRQALAFLPNEIWIHAGDSIRWTFPTHERHTLTFLKPGQIRPPGVWPYLRNSGRMSGNYTGWIKLRWIRVRHVRCSVIRSRYDDSADLFGNVPDGRELQVCLPDSRGHDRSRPRRRPGPGYFRTIRTFMIGTPRAKKYGCLRTPLVWQTEVRMRRETISPLVSAKSSRRRGQVRRLYP